MHRYKAAYSAALRQQIVELVQSGRSPKELAKEFGCHVTSVHHWVSVANDALTHQIKAAHMMSDQTYGRARIRAELAAHGIIPNHKRIARLMRCAAIAGVSQRRNFTVTTERDLRQRPAPDLVNRQFSATDINQLWVADMTYIPTWAGFGASQ